MKRRLFVLGVVVALATPLNAWAQDIEDASGGRTGDLSKVHAALLREVRLTDKGGLITTGVLQSVEGDTLTVLTLQGTRPAQITALRRVERRGDSLKNGILIGALAGALLIGGSSITDESIGPAAVLGFPLGAGVGAGVGACVDALQKGWTTIYKRPTAD